MCRYVVFYYAKYVYVNIAKNPVGKYKYGSNIFASVPCVNNL